MRQHNAIARNMLLPVRPSVTRRGVRNVQFSANKSPYLRNGAR